MRALDESWPDRPEWLDMLTAILEKNAVEPGDGWFRTAVAQTRFDWKSTQKQYDRNGDDRIGRDEFPGSEEDFARLDRDRDQVLTESDFDFETAAPTTASGSVIFSRADLNGNGKVSRDEFDELFRANDSGGQGFLSLSDLQEAIPQPPRATPGSG